MPKQFQRAFIFHLALSSTYLPLRLSWHGWPVSQPLAQAMGCKILDVNHLLKPHQLAGSGFHLGCAYLAWMSFLACVEFKEDCESVPRSLPPPQFKLIRVPQNGRCFLACLFLFTNSTTPAFAEWGTFLRSNTSMPLDLATGEVSQSQLKREERCFLVE